MSLTANAGVQYDFTRRTALYFEPGVSYYLTETALPGRPGRFRRSICLCSWACV